MRKIIRQNVWETNSSSSHSLSIKPSIQLSDFNIPLNADGYIEAKFDQYGWGYSELHSQEEKLSYLLTIVKYEAVDYIYRSDDLTQDAFRATEGFQILNDFCKKYCNGISTNNTDMGHGYIDHQSNEGSLRNYLQNNGTTIEEIILNDKAYIIIDNDNGGDYE